MTTGPFPWEVVDTSDDYKHERLLTDEQALYLHGWVRRAADLLGLREWSIVVTPWRVDDETAYAGTFIRDYGDQARVSIGRRFLTIGADEQRRTLTHELLHPPFYRVTRPAIRMVTGHLGRMAEDLFRTALTDAEELAIDRLATAIAPFLPMVELPRGEAVAWPKEESAEGETVTRVGT